MKTKPNIWLYPISATSGYFFEVDGRRTEDTSLESFTEMMGKGIKSNPDDEWGIHRNRKRVQLGDQIVVYSCKTQGQPACIIGLATIVEEPADRPKGLAWMFKLRWNKQITLRLCKKPLDATYLTDRLPQTKPSVTTLTPALQNWVRKQLGL